MAIIQAVIALMLLMSCETTRDNTQQEKVRTRTVICNVPDRCGITP